MARMEWNVAGSRFYEAGVDRGVLYIGEDPGVPWIGLISVEEEISGGEATPYYIDGAKYLNLSASEEFQATITAYTYPVEFSQCDGTERVRPGLLFSQQKRKSFGFSYRTRVGNDIGGTDHAYKIHLIYEALATPSTRSTSSFADSIEASDFSWGLTTKPPSVSGYAPTSHVVVDSRYTHPDTLADIEDILYGTESTVPRLLSAEELIEIFDTPVVWSVTDNGDGTFLVAGPNENVADIGLDSFQLDHPSVEIVDEDSFTITY